MERQIIENMYEMQASFIIRSTLLEDFLILKNESILVLNTKVFLVSGEEAPGKN